MEYKLVEIWLRRDPIRWISGALAGLLAGAIAMGVAAEISTVFHMDFWFPLKLMGTILLGPSSTDINQMQGALAGGIIVEAIGLFFGVIFAHFTGTNSVGSLLAMGLVWGAFSWIFIWNLFLQSFRPIFAARIPAGPVFPVCMAFGLSMAFVSLFDRILRGNKKR